MRKVYEELQSILLQTDALVKLSIHCQCCGYLRTLLQQVIIFYHYLHQQLQKKTHSHLQTFLLLHYLREHLVLQCLLLTSEGIQAFSFWALSLYQSSQRHLGSYLHCLFLHCECLFIHYCFLSSYHLHRVQLFFLSQQIDILILSSQIPLVSHGKPF